MLCLQSGDIGNRESPLGERTDLFGGSFHLLSLPMIRSNRRGYACVSSCALFCHATGPT
jgi:hypothetical protein